jgi:hypothetical protein
MDGAGVAWCCGYRVVVCDGRSRGCVVLWVSCCWLTNVAGRMTVCVCVCGGGIEVFKRASLSRMCAFADVCFLFCFLFPVCLFGWFDNR